MWKGNIFSPGLEILFQISEKRPPLLAKMLYADEEFHNVRSNPIFLLEKEQFEGQLMKAAMRGGGIWKPYFTF